MSEALIAYRRTQFVAAYDRGLTAYVEHLPIEQPLQRFIRFGGKEVVRKGVNISVQRTDCQTVYYAASQIWERGLILNWRPRYTQRVIKARKAAQHMADHMNLAKKGFSQPEREYILSRTSYSANESLFESPVTS